MATLDASFGSGLRARGMQVHAVPENERAYDSAGRKLPWAYDTAGTAASLEKESREPVEKGPFGRSMRRSRSGASRSRSKTAEPKREEDRLRAEQVAAEDAVFGSMRKVVKEEGRGAREALGDVDPNVVAQQPANVSAAQEDQEVTEVMLYGFGRDLQWSAIDFYERVSDGNILEDYERVAPGQRYDLARSFTRSTARKSLTKDALRKKNRYAGGEHWIKVTFSSRQAAELACARSPHTIMGHLVYAEPYQGRGPARDEPVFASQAGAQITSSNLPLTFSTSTLQDSPNGSSSTATSATATAAIAGSEQPQALARQTQDVTTHASHAPENTTATGLQRLPRGTQQPHRRGRIEGVRSVTLLPADQALMPKQSKQSWTAWLGASELIGTTVPKREDGAFDWERASLYWRVFNVLDRWFGTDFCGSRGDE